MNGIAVSKKLLFGQVDFSAISADPDFKEDSVREIIILPILNALGYTPETIIRSKTLVHPFLKTGSKRRPINLIPDYVLRVGNYYAWVLDAKAPNQDILSGDNVEQAYSYAAHPEIRSTYFALCNGIAFSVFRTADTDKPILFFPVENIEQYWDSVKLYLSPESFRAGKYFVYTAPPAPQPHASFDYAERPLLHEIPVKKQVAKRHFGCNAYFTRQAWNVVAAYIKNFSQPGDLILDPFGGSGVTAIEALMNARRAIHIDINPLSVFIAQSLAIPVNLADFGQAFNEVKSEYIKREPKIDEEVEKALKKYRVPKNLPLPKGSDVKTVEQLFTKKQIAQLALLKTLIKKVKNENCRKSLLLAFSNTVTVINKTFHETPRGGGNHFGYYYRYRIAPNPAYKNTVEVFENKFKRIYNGKKEMEYFINEQAISCAQIQKGSATDLSFLPDESVDYIYTDPPYGKKIPYLDLSVMWNAWLDFDVTEQDYELEAIEGGKQQKSKGEYNALIAQSIKEMYRVLKFDRWLSFVFAHKDPEFWHLILNTAEACGFEYAGAVPQKNGQTSFKKRQNPFTVLSGELIINFRKARNPRAVLKANLGMDIAEIVIQTAEGIIAKNDGATIEQINDEIIIKGLELGFLDLLRQEYEDLTPILTNSFDYNKETEMFTIRKDKKFQSHIEVKLRIRYYLISYVRRVDRAEHRNPRFDEIVLHILPLLKNGDTPEEQTILSVLEDVGERTADDCWRLKQAGQGEFAF
jgi:DNA modification methylase